MSSFPHFRELHHQNELLLLANAWDTHSATVFEKAGFKALGTSSAALANTLGYADGENIPFADLLFVVKKIRAAVQLPLSVDLETGFHPELSGVLRNLEQLIEVGVVGVNLEDSVRGAGRSLVSMDDFARKVEAVKNHLVKNKLELFLNIRTDAFLLGVPEPLKNALQRIPAYESAGADGIFVPFLREESDIRAVVAATRLPLNVLSMSGLASFPELAAWGVKRVSMGSSVYRALYRHLDKLIGEALANQSYAGLFD